MTDEMRAREKAICEVAKVNSIGEVSDGFHTFNGLYEQRMILFAALVKAYKDKAWKSYRHEDGEYCFGGGWFIVGIDTPEGSYTYHYENKYWDMFDCVDLPRGKRWDGHTEADAETRLMSLSHPEPKRGKWETAYLDHVSMGIRPKVLYCSECNQCIAYPTNFCPNCGTDMRTAAQIVHDAIDNTPMAEDVFPGIKERLHKAVDDMREVTE